MFSLGQGSIGDAAVAAAPCDKHQHHDSSYSRDVEAGEWCNSSTFNKEGVGGTGTPPLYVESLDDDMPGPASCEMISQARRPAHQQNEVPVRFRPLQESDRDEIQSLHEDWFPVRYADEFFDDLVHNRIAGSDEPLYSCVAVASDRDDGGERIIGCIVGSFVEIANCKGKTVELLITDPDRHSRMFYIMTLGTVKEYRGMGLATTLVQECMDLVKECQTCGALYLHVITYNKAAIRFYERLGFYQVDEIKDYYIIDEKKYNSYLYAKYFHGNRGHFTMYTLLTSLVSTVWRTVSSPLYSLFE